jgi:hypothetical protein
LNSLVAAIKAGRLSVAIQATQPAMPKSGKWSNEFIKKWGFNPQTIIDKFHIKEDGRHSLAYQVFLRSPQWEAKRKQVESRDKYCRACGVTTGLQCHHIEKFYPPKTNSFERDFEAFATQDESQLTTLCAKHHSAIHGRSTVKRKQRSRK